MTAHTSPGADPEMETESCVAIGALSSRLQQPRVQRTICATDWRSFPGTDSVPTKNRSSRPAAHASLITRPSRLGGDTNSVQSGASGCTTSQERRRGVLVSADPPGPIALPSAMPTRPPSVAIVADDPLSRTPLWHPVIATIADTATAVATLHTIRRGQKLGPRPSLSIEGQPELPAASPAIVLAIVGDGAPAQGRLRLPFRGDGAIEVRRRH